ncbi:cyclase family protein [Streptomyces sp. SL13]|uniref:Cyclase family protein n=1 Tax=Streptantibioticus silvisoli TaxID=2705255 RepID=A0AA90HD02_9ACTN|nr:cyclase family protein [Streptantibioticus silvisoli]MDI5967333.1 cyclase family protein [Streptantibioticus silvisoli]MDI5972652.1 cyclase family protein [Streptantibioticus silvisoli]
MRLIDLSSPVDSTFWEPDPVTHTVLSPAEGARHMASEMKAHFGLDFPVETLPGGEFLSNDTLTLTTHTGTHVDAPSHYGTASHGTARHIDEMPLEWFHRPAVVVDVRDVGTGVVGERRLKEEFDRIGRYPDALDIVILHTGAYEWVGTPRYFTDFAGLDGSGVNYLLDLGVRVIGTDAFSLDAPFTHIIDTFRRTGDRAVLWPAHFAGREREYCQIERLANLAAVPSHGFQVSCFPVKIARAGAGWARAVAILD